MSNGNRAIVATEYLPHSSHSSTYCLSRKRHLLSFFHAPTSKHNSRIIVATRAMSSMGITKRPSSYAIHERGLGDIRI